MKGTDVVGAPPPEMLAEVGRRWSAFLLEQNRRGTRAVLFIVLLLYPSFGVLDYLMAPPESLWLLWGSRAVVTLCTALMFPVLRSAFFARWPAWTSAGYMLICAIGIALMIVLMGGLASPYYAGLSLAMVAIGLLFIWPARVVLTTHTAIVALYVAPNLLLGEVGEGFAAVSNLFFLVSTAFVVVVGQILYYRAQYAQQVTQLTLEQTKANLQEAHDQLKELDQFKTKFFANITHELKTPLAMILSPLELLIGGEIGGVSDVQKRTFHAMLRNGFKLLKLINDLLDLTRLEESRIQLRVAEHDLVAYLTSLVGQVQTLAQRKNVAMELTAEVPESLVFCDLERMERVFVNLLSNAAKFTPPGGRIDVRLRDLGDRVLVEVQDNGPGFPSDQADRLFERFYQVDMDGTRQHGGTGIGLALAKELVELHGGTISARGAVGEGACFTVTLLKDRAHFRPEALAPETRTETSFTAHQPETDILSSSVEVTSRGDYRLLDIAEATERRVVERDADENQRQWTVLIVEDTPDVIRVIHLALRRHFKVLAAPDGLKGLELAQRELPSLIITDLMMPGIDGLELTRRLRDDPRTKHIPIVMLTARGAIDDRVAGLDSGVNAYLSKPFSPKELLSTARALLNIQETQADLLLSQRLDSLETMAGGLAHEINNPLNYVKNAVKRVQLDLVQVVELAKAATERPLTAAEAAQLDKLDTRMHRMVETAESGVHRIAGTVELMGRYSREGYTRAARSHDVFEAARDVIKMVLPTTGREVTIDTSFEGDGEIECIPEEFHQVLTNLVQNAIEASPEEGGRVEVRGLGDATGLVLTVRDNGPGIKDEDKAKIFAPFFTTKGPGRGMGMGLTITRRVVQGLGGTIAVHSEPGAGTEFVVRLPRAPAS